MSNSHSKINYRYKITVEFDFNLRKNWTDSRKKVSQTDYLFSKTIENIILNKIQIQGFETVRNLKIQKRPNLDQKNFLGSTIMRNQQKRFRILETLNYTFVWTLR